MCVRLHRCVRAHTPPRALRASVHTETHACTWRRALMRANRCVRCRELPVCSHASILSLSLTLAAHTQHPTPSAPHSHCCCFTAACVSGAAPRPSLAYTLSHSQIRVCSDIDEDRSSLPAAPPLPDLLHTLSQHLLAAPGSSHTASPHLINGHHLPDLVVPVRLWSQHLHLCGTQRVWE